MGTLHVVATPIGHLEDVTLRALGVLRAAGVVYAEDTRRTRVLFERHGISTRLVSLHAHNETSRIPEVLARLDAGEAVALVSDAGTPAVSDPGARLIAAVADAGHAVVAVPGASALLAALASSGLRIATFTFLGFVPRRPGARRRLFESVASSPAALVLYEAPSRIGTTLAELAEVLGKDRRAAVGRELTKLHEEVVRGTLAGLAEHFADGARGEITLVVEGRDARAADAEEPVDEELLERSIEELAAAGLRTREIAAELAERTGMARRALYARVVATLGPGAPEQDELDGDDDSDAGDAEASGS